MTFNIENNYTPKEEQQGSDGEPMGAFEGQNWVLPLSAKPFNKMPLV